MTTATAVLGSLSGKLERQRIVRAAYQVGGITQRVAWNKYPNGVNEVILIEFPDKSKLTVSIFAVDASKNLQFKLKAS